MEFKDASYGYPPASRASFISGIPKIHHNKCGGRIWHYNPDDGNEKYSCHVCDQVWHGRSIDSMTDDEVAVRFHLRGDKDTTTTVIVWQVDKFSNMQHTTLVPVSEATKWERFKP